MEAGRELDALVAEKIFGLPQSLWREGKDFRDENGVGLVEFGVMPAPYSTDIKAAWEVVEKTGLLNIWSLFRNNDHWVIGHQHPETNASDKIICSELTAPHVICLAALKTVGA